jgi:hypothetical protein
MVSPPLLRCFWELVRLVDFYMGSEQVPLTMMGLSLPLLNTCLAKDTMWKWGGVLKWPTLLRDPCLIDFISHGHPSSLKASFESEYSPWTFTWYQIHRFVAMIGLFLPLLSTCLAISLHTWEGVLKCPTSLRFPSLLHFISYGIPSSLKASFESE